MNRWLFSTSCHVQILSEHSSSNSSHAGKIVSKPDQHRSTAKCKPCSARSQKCVKDALDCLFAHVDGGVDHQLDAANLTLNDATAQRKRREELVWVAWRLMFTEPQSVASFVSQVLAMYHP